MRFVCVLFQVVSIIVGLPIASVAADGEIGVQLYTASRTEGTMIQKVVPGSPADQAGLREDSVITHVDGRKVSDADSFRALLSSYQPGKSVKLQLLDNEVVATADVVLAARGSKYRNPLEAPEYLEAVEEADDVGARMDQDYKRPGKPVIGLEIDAAYVSDRSFDFFRDFTQLQSLTIEDYAFDNKFTGVGLQQLSELPLLQTIVLRDWTLKPSFAEHLVHLRGLKALDLEKCELAPGALDRVADVTKLERLELNGAKIGDGDIASVARMTSLKTLDLNNTIFRGESLAEFHQLKDLQHLYIVNTDVTDEDLVHLKELPQLVSLGLSETRITENGLAALSHLSKLEILGLSYLKSPGNEEPSEDDPSDGAVTGSVIEATEDSIADGAVERSRNPTVSIASIEKPLGHLTSIHELWIEGPDFEPSDVRRLARIFPKAKIVTSDKTILPRTR